METTLATILEHHWTPLVAMHSFLCLFVAARSARRLMRHLVDACTLYLDATYVNLADSRPCVNAPKPPHEAATRFFFFFGGGGDGWR